MLFFLPLILCVGALLSGLSDNLSVIGAIGIVPSIPLAGYGCYVVAGYEQFDPNGNRFDSILEMLADYVDDWTIDKIMGKGAYSKTLIGYQYRLHENVEIRRGVTEDTATTTKNHDMHIFVTDPTTKVTVRYDPGRSYRHRFEAALDALHTYRELGTIVAISIDAEKRRSSPGTARAALDDFRAAKGLVDKSADPDTKAAA